MNEFWKVLILLYLAVVLNFDLLGARLEPAPVPSISHEGMRYEVVHQPTGYARDQTGGYVTVRDIKTNKINKDLKIYDICYNLKLERDVQDVFIKRMVQTGNQLELENESGEKFILNLKNHHIKPLQPSKQPINQSRTGSGCIKITRLKVVANVQKGSVSFDGMLAGEIGVPIEVSPNKPLVIEVESPGFPPIKREVSPKPGVENVVRIKFERKKD